MEVSNADAKQNLVQELPVELLEELDACGCGCAGGRGAGSGSY